MALRDSEKGVRIAGWESRDGKYHTVYNEDGKKVGRAPSDKQLERSERAVIWDPQSKEFYTISRITPRLDLDRLIEKIRDYYSEVAG